MIIYAIVIMVRGTLWISKMRDCDTELDAYGTLGVKQLEFRGGGTKLRLHLARERNVRIVYSAQYIPSCMYSVMVVEILIVMRGFKRPTF